MSNMRRKCFNEFDLISTSLWCDALTSYSERKEKSFRFFFFHMLDKFFVLPTYIYLWLIPLDRYNLPSLLLILLPFAIFLKLIVTSLSETRFSIEQLLAKAIERGVLRENWMNEGWCDDATLFWMDLYIYICVFMFMTTMTTLWDKNKFTAVKIIHFWAYTN